MKCYEYEGFGHIKTECHTFIKKQKKGLSITWPESDDERKGEIANKVMAFIEKYDFCSECSDDEMLVEELAKTYREFLFEWKESHLRDEKQMKTISAILLKKDKLG